MVTSHKHYLNFILNTEQFIDSITTSYYCHLNILILTMMMTMTMTMLVSNRLDLQDSKEGGKLAPLSLLLLSICHMLMIMMMSICHMMMMMIISICHHNFLMMLMIKMKMMMMRIQS